MLKNRILATLKFFDLQGYALTLLELQTFLISDREILKSSINTDWELVNHQALGDKISASEILNCLEQECAAEVESEKGFYCLSGRKNLIDLRWRNYLYGLKREKLLKKYISRLEE